MGLVFKKEKEEDGQIENKTKQKMGRRIKTKPSEAMTCSSQASLAIAQAPQAVRVPGGAAQGVPSGAGKEAAPAPSMT